MKAMERESIALQGIQANPKINSTSNRIIMEKSIQNPHLNKSVGERLYEDSKRREREIELQ
jgi:hypothetical protein